MSLTLILICFCCYCCYVYALFRYNHCYYVAFTLITVIIGKHNSFSHCNHHYEKPDKNHINKLKTNPFKDHRGNSEESTKQRQNTHASLTLNSYLQAIRLPLDLALPIHGAARNNSLARRWSTQWRHTVLKTLRSRPPWSRRRRTIPTHWFGLLSVCKYFHD